MLKNLFKFFFGGEEKAVVIEKELDIEGLKVWLNSDANESLKLFWKDANLKLENIADKILKIEESIRILKEVNLSDREGLNQRVKDIIFTNRDNYIRHLEKLFSNLKRERKFKDVNDIKIFSLLISSELDTFSEKSLKNYHTASTFIGKELGEITKLLQELGSIGREIQNIDKTKAENIEGIQRLLEKVEKEKEITNNLKEKEESILSEIDTLNKKFNELKIKEENIKKSDKWKEKEQLEKELIKVSEEKELIKQELKGLFAPTEKAMQKYSWKEKEKKTKKLILGYLENPVTAFKEDKEMKILSCLQNIRVELEEGNFEDKRKEKLLEGIKNLTKEKINVLLKKDLELENRTIKIKDLLSRIIIEKIDFDSLNGKKRNIEEELGNTQKKIKEILNNLGDRKNEIGRLLKGFGKKLI